MQWLLELETEKDPISTCRLMNIFRRKGVNIVTLSLEAGPAEFAMKALVETAESEVAHIFNFLRRTEGVRHVTCYRDEGPANASGAGKGDARGMVGGIPTPAEDDSLILHTSRPGNGDSGAINAKTRVPVETMSVRGHD
jgi:hypothetical protein